MNQDADYELVRRCQSSDPDVYEAAFEELYARYRDRVFNTAYRVVGNASDAADVSQEVFLTIFRKVGEFQFVSRFFTWLYRITVNLAIDKKRRASLSPPTVSEGSEGALLTGVEDVASEAPGAWADAEFLEGKVQQSIGRLSPKLRAIVVLRYVEELSYSDIAEVMACSIGTVKSRLNRAHRNLEALLKPVIEALAEKGES